jgi:hypothetical protein
MTPGSWHNGFLAKRAGDSPSAVENLQSNKFISYFAGHYSTIRHTD